MFSCIKMFKRPGYVLFPFRYRSFSTHMGSLAYCKLCPVKKWVLESGVYIFLSSSVCVMMVGSVIVKD